MRITCRNVGKSLRIMDRQLDSPCSGLWWMTRTSRTCTGLRHLDRKYVAIDKLWYKHNSTARRNRPREYTFCVPFSMAQDTGEGESKSQERLFSNLAPDLSHQPGSVTGAATLVAGTAVGAGILALPAVCQPAGFVASATAISGAALFSIVTGLLVSEVSLNTMCELGISSGVSLGSMAERTLGKNGKLVVSLTYSALHYALLVAYISKAGETIHQMNPAIPIDVADIAFALGITAICYKASPKILDKFNGVLVGSVIGSFVFLLAIVAPDVDVSVLSEANWSQLTPALPVIALAFVFQNVCPYVCSSLEGDVDKIRKAIILGIAIPWLMFLAWDAAVLGSAAAFNSIDAMKGFHTVDPLNSLRATGPLAANLIDTFSLLAIATSFIGFVLGLSEFVAEALQKPIGKDKEIPIAATVLPPLALAITFPDVFFKALDFAGTYGVLVLFGILPCAMVWQERYSDPKVTLGQIQVGPKSQLVILLTGLVASAIILEQFSKSVGILHR